MKVSLNWAQDCSNVDLLKLPKDDLLQKIGAQIGAIEETEDWSNRFDKALIVRVVSCLKHPNADKLHICLIDDGKTVKGIAREDKGYVQVVCGAPNVHADMYAVWLPPGATVPSTLDKDPLVLESRNIRGEISNGMLASAAELGLSDDYSGIVDLDIKQLGEDIKSGTPLNRALRLDDELVVDIENKMFTHRPDLFGILGVARELAGIQGLTFKSPDWYREEPKFQTANTLPLEVKVENKKQVPRFMAVAMKNVKIGPSPLRVQAELTRVGIRPINNVVDITNYVMHLTGQPLHAYDYDKVKALSGSKPTLIAREAKKGEQLELLNGKTVSFDTPAILITTDKKVLGVGGVMGGAETEVDENTRNIILECANFDMYSIRRTAMKYGIFTDAVTRFNKGQSVLQNDRVLQFAMKMVQEIAKGDQASSVKDVHGPLQAAKTVRITPSFINERLGLNLSPKKMTELLENVEFKVRPVAAKQLAVTPPFWRTDIAIQEDIVEEIGRLYGYDHLPLELPRRNLTPAAKNELMELKTNLRNRLSRAGANEVLTYSFVHGDLMKKAGQDPKHAFQLNNAISPDLQYYRTSLTPSLLEKIHPNVKAGYEQFAIFELNKVHYKGEWDEEESEVPNEDNHLSLITTNNTKSLVTSSAYYQAKHYLDQLILQRDATLVPLTSFDISKDEWGEQLTAPYEPGRSAIILKEDLIWGVVGEFRTNVRRAFKLPDYTAGFEINLGVISGSSLSYQPIPRFPRVEQDITLKIPSSVSYGEACSLLKESLAQLKPEQTIASLVPLDIYQKEPTSKHVTWRLSIASYERTLTDQVVNSLLDEIAGSAKQLGAERL